MIFATLAVMFLGDSAYAFHRDGCGSVAEFEGGSLYDDRGINVLELRGDWHQMGRQYGCLAKGFLEDMLSYLDLEIGENQNQIAMARAIADSLYQNYPEYLKDFFCGMKETSGLEMDRLKLCNAAEYVEGCFFCSAMAVWGDYSAGGLVMGRNYDAVSYGEVCRNLMLTVFHPDDGISAATFGYAGEIYCVNGINEKGIFIELNNGMPSAGWEIDWSICPATTRLFDLLFAARSLDDVDDFFRNVRSSASFAIGVADRNEARVYEWCRQGVKRGDVITPDGLMVSTNHYSNPEWGFPIPAEDSCWNSGKRRANILKYAGEHKGAIGVPQMKEIMSTPISEGGPFHDLTRYQIVAVPSEIALHVKVPYNGDWVKVSLPDTSGGTCRSLRCAAGEDPTM